MTDTGQKFLRMHIRRYGKAMVLDICGSVGMYESQQLRKKLDLLVGRGAPLIILELSRMDFICSTGLGAIISAHLKLDQQGGRLLLVSPTESVLSLFETTRLTEVFRIYPTVQQAAAADQ